MARLRFACRAVRIVAAASLGCGGTVYTGGFGDVGDACTAPYDCRPGLICLPDRTCGFEGTKTDGEECAYTAECSAGLYCASERREDPVRWVAVCRPAGSVDDGGACGATADCRAGLACLPSGFGGTCGLPGTGRIGEECASAADCRAGLVCNTRGRCSASAGTEEIHAYPVWQGVECVGDEVGAPRFHFEVPRGPLRPGQDFFRLPWPNDARRLADGSLDLGGFPHPAMPGMPVDVLDRFLRASERDLDGYGTNGAVFLRSSVGIDFDTLRAGGDDPTIYLVDLTPPPPGGDYWRLGLGWGASTGGGRYICPNWVGVRSLLLPARTYAVVLTDGVRAATGAPMVRDADFSAVVSPDRPAGDPDLVRAWNAYAPFRDYLAAEGIAPASILVAAVFTTQAAPETLRRAREVVAAAAVPSSSDVVLCDAGVVSPCDDGLAGTDRVRGCFDADPDHYEIQGTFRLAVFQEGRAPYVEPDDGGGIEFDADGSLRVQGHEPVCFALTVPAGAAMPADGWPVVVYAHGTGGDYRTAVRAGIARALSRAGAAVFSFDLPRHGSRRGASTAEPDVLFFNYANPPAALGNVLQGAVDVFQASRFLAALDLDAATSPTGEPLRIDASRILLYGHSQGATHGMLALPFEPGLRSAVLSGAGSSLIETLLSKTSPYDVAGAVRMSLGDPFVGEAHPALSVFQMYMERADPVNYLRHVVWDPPAPAGPRHVLQVYGVGDTYAPRRTQLITAGQLGVQVGLAPGESIIDMSPGEAAGWETAALPASANRRTASGDVTVILSQHDPAGAYDGHFVSTRDSAAARRIERFVQTAILDGVPTVEP
ncbi:MAG: hypothetical protein QME96_06425 [Myxococcota bacterium]|nr:hypothetical protein [Myxococcota bacterium]